MRKSALEFENTKAIHTTIACLVAKFFGLLTNSLRQWIQAYFLLQSSIFTEASSLLKPCKNFTHCCHEASFSFEFSFVYLPQSHTSTVKLSKERLAMSM